MSDYIVKSVGSAFAVSAVFATSFLHASFTSDNEVVKECSTANRCEIYPEGFLEALDDLKRMDALKEKRLKAIEYLTSIGGTDPSATAPPRRRSVDEHSR